MSNDVADQRWQRRQRRYGALTPAEIAALDAAAVDAGVGILQLMEMAGAQVARLAWRLLGRRPGDVHVVAGHGNNGGDGLVAARHLAAWGCGVSAFVLGEPGRLDDVAEVQCRAARGADVAVTVANDPADAAPPLTPDLVVDALLGTGLSAPPRPAHAAIIAAMRGTILSVDVPSGLDAGDGSAPGAVVRATATCTLTGCKRGLWEPRAHAVVGALFVADIGMPRTAWERCGLVAPTAVRGGTLLQVPL